MTFGKSKKNQKYGPEIVADPLKTTNKMSCPNIKPYVYYFDISTIN
jgi:hypothetical protein